MPIEAFDGTASDAVFDFLAARVGDRGRAFWAWKYRLRSGHEPSGFYWRENDGTVLGFVGLMRTTLYGPGGPWPAAWLVDWHVARDARGVDVGAELLREAKAATGILATLQASADTSRLLPRLGWCASTRAATWLRPLSGRLAGAWARRNWSSWLDAPVSAFARAFMSLRMRRRPAPPAFPAPGVELLPVQHDEVWLRRCVDLAPVMSRDRATLDWFCGADPEGGYWIALLRSDGSPCGHLVTRTDRDSSGLLRGRIVDLVWPGGRSEWLDHAIGLACRQLQSSGADYVQCVSSRTELDAALQRAQFFRDAPIPLWYDQLPAGAPHPDTWHLSLLDCDRAYR